jgi:hypothetical protein
MPSRERKEGGGVEVISRSSEGPSGAATFANCSDKAISIDYWEMARTRSEAITYVI